MNLKSPGFLLVEDNPTDIGLFEHVLGRLQLRHRLRVVTDGEEAVNYLNAEPPFEDRQKHPRPAMVFLDLNLPRKSGLEVLSWMRSDRRFDRTLAVILTSSNWTIDVYRAYELGANSYLVKPVSIAALENLAANLNLPWILRDEAFAPVQCDLPVHFPTHSLAELEGFSGET